MTRHARTGILLCGWLLMQPPSPDVTRDGKYVDRAGKATGIGGEPVTEWYQVAAFDTAERCERARLEGHQQLAAAVKKKPRRLTCIRGHSQASPCRPYRRSPRSGPGDARANIDLGLPKSLRAGRGRLPTGAARPMRQRTRSEVRR